MGLENYYSAITGGLLIGISACVLPLFAGQIAGLSGIINGIIRPEKMIYPVIKLFFVLFSGLLFGAGLSMSTMLDRRRIINFLEITGDWDPALLFVMSGAVFATLIFFRFILKRNKPLCDNRFYLPVKKQLNINLIAGSAIFGAGWGLSGFCPGPGFAALTLGLQAPVIFCAGYIIGSIACRYYLDISKNDCQS